MRCGNFLKNIDVKMNDSFICELNQKSVMIEQKSIVLKKQNAMTSIIFVMNIEAFR